MMRVVLMLWLLLLFTACEEGDNPQAGTSYEIAVGDTLITIPAEAARFASEHFEWHAYMLREYQVAIVPHGGGAAYTGSLLEWKNSSWNLRRTFLIAPYVHDLRTDALELYYYSIGTYPDQFGYGWVDTYDPEADLSNGTVRPWLHPADSTLVPDNPGTLGFDGGLGDMLEFRGMWTVE